MSEGITVKFVQITEKYPCLYNYSSSEYFQNITEKARKGSEMAAAKRISNEIQRFNQH